MLSAILGFLSGTCALLAGATLLLLIPFVIAALVRPRLPLAPVMALSFCAFVWAVWAVALSLASAATAAP